MSIFCKIGLHNWVDIRDPIGTMPVEKMSAGPNGVGWDRIFNRVCKWCGKQDLKANRAREKMAQKERLAERVYGEQ